MMQAGRRPQAIDIRLVCAVLVAPTLKNEPLEVRVIAFFQLLALAVFFVGGLRPDFDHSLPPRRGGGEVVLVVLVGPWSKGGLNLVKTWSEFWSSKIEHPCNVG
jgi:hypothetical protein